MAVNGVESLRVRRAGLALLLVLLLTPAAPTTAATTTPAATTTLTVDPEGSLGPVNSALGGLNWTPGAAEHVEPLRPPVARFDAFLNRASPSPDVLDLSETLAHVADIRSIGGEPLVILEAIPLWLAPPNTYGRHPSKVRPADLAAWEDLVRRSVVQMAHAGARRFEAWNEPDVPVFWQDTPQAFAEMAAASARGVARAEAETGIDLAFGGPGTAFPDPVYLAAFLEPFRRDPTLPLDFISWHYYGNYPFFGPDGAEDGVFPEELKPAYPVVGRRNPAAHPGSFGGGIDLMRQWTAAGLAGTGRPFPELILDEWNLSAGGWDKRHDTHEGAAFAAGVLIEMQEHGLDVGAVFRAMDTRPGVEGEHGLVTVDGERKPAWWTFWLWQRLMAERVPVTGASEAEGLRALASRGSNRMTVLVASFSAAAPADRTIRLHVPGWRPIAIRQISAEHDVRRRKISSATFDLPAQSVALVELVPARRP